MLLRNKDKNKISKDSGKGIRNVKKQLDLDLPSSRIEILYKFKRVFRQIEKNFTAVPFWRNGLIWSAITTIIGVTIIITVLIGKFYSNLPPEVPLVYNTLEEKWENYPKIFLFAVPIMLILLGILNIRLLQKVYYMNKKLTLMICLLITITYILELIAVNEILVISTS